MKLDVLNTKICIVGAGPAGAALSVFLGKENIKHITVDAATFPRDKICGDGLDLKAITMLNHIDKSIIERHIKTDGNINPSWGFRIISSNGKLTDFEYKPKIGNENKPPYGVSKRIDLDVLLISKMNPAYTLFLQSTKVYKIERIANKWKVFAKNKDQEIEINCDLIIGADGDHSIVLKYVAERKINRNHYAAGVRQYWQGIENIHPKNLMEVYYPKSKPMSYFWIFPLANGLANVGFGMLSAVAAKENYNIRAVFIDLIKNDPVLKGRFKAANAIDSISGWGLPFASLKRGCSGDGWLLLGDAGSMISPTTGEGIGTGMQTAFIASKFIKKAILENKFDKEIFKNYDREIYKRMKDDIRLFNISMWLSPKMMGWFMNNLIQLPYFKKLFQQKVGKWLNAAYNKEITVNLE